MEMGDRIVVRVAGQAVPWSRAGQKGKFKFTPKKQAVYMDVLRLTALRSWPDGPPLDCPLSVTMAFYFPWPLSIPKKKRGISGNHIKRTKPDIDNLYKIVADALNGVLWVDDSQIARLTLNKLFSDTPETIITVERLA